MDKTTKVNILYKIARGEFVNLSPAEKRELDKYRVSGAGTTFATKININAYVSAVDKQGYRKSLYNWCIENEKGDRRTKAGRAESLRSFKRNQGMASALLGCLLWGVALYWIFGGALSVGACAIMGSIVAFILNKANRETTGFSCLLLPCILAAIFGSR